MFSFCRFWHSKNTIMSQSFLFLECEHFHLFPFRREKFEKYHYYRAKYILTTYVIYLVPCIDNLTIPVLVKNLLTHTHSVWCAYNHIYIYIWCISRKMEQSNAHKLKISKLNYMQGFFSIMYSLKYFLGRSPRASVKLLLNNTQLLHRR